MKRVSAKTAWIIVIIIAVGLIGNGSVYAVENEPSDWATDAIDEAVSLGLVIDGRTYHQKATRLQLVTWLVELLEVIQDEPIQLVMESPFTDTGSDVIAKAYQLGWVKGDGAGRFNPEDSVTRQEMAVMMSRFLDYMNRHSQEKIGIEVSDSLSALSAYADATEIASWAKAPLIQMNQMDVIMGVGNDRLQPLGYTTNEQGIVMLMRLVERLREEAKGPFFVGILEEQDKGPVTFKFLSMNKSIGINETESVSITLKELVQHSDMDKVTFVDSENKFDFGKLTYSQDLKQLIITADGVNRDQSQVVYLQITDGRVTLNGRLTIRVQDVKNFEPQPVESLDFDVDAGSTVIIRAKELATDEDGDMLRITRYRRLSGSYGSGVLDNGPEESYLSFSASAYEGDEERIQQYKLTITDGVVPIQIPISIHVHPR